MENGKTPISATVIYNSNTGLKCGQHFGLTKREYFAGLAMQGILADGETSKIPSIAKAAIIIADELLTQLENKQP